MQPAKNTLDSFMDNVACVRGYHDWEMELDNQPHQFYTKCRNCEFRINVLEELKPYLTADTPDELEDIISRHSRYFPLEDF